MSDDIEMLRFWIRIVVVIATLCTTALPILYSFSPWRTHALGRLFMMMAVSFEATMILSCVFMFWKPDVRVVFWVDAIALTAIAISTSRLTWWVWKMNFSRKRSEYASHRRRL